MVAIDHTLGNQQISLSHSCAQNNTVSVPRIDQHRSVDRAFIIDHHTPSEGHHK
jgi:hypothetical protein